MSASPTTSPRPEVTIMGTPSSLPATAPIAPRLLQKAWMTAKGALRCSAAIERSIHSLAGRRPTLWTLAPRSSHEPGRSSCRNAKTCTSWPATARRSISHSRQGITLPVPLRSTPPGTSSAIFTRAACVRGALHREAVSLSCGKLATSRQTASAGSAERRRSHAPADDSLATAVAIGPGSRSKPSSSGHNRSATALAEEFG